MLVYDGSAGRMSSVDEVDKYYLRKEPVPAGGLMATPCGSCPVAAQCTEGGVISPATCVYLPEWLKF